MTSRNDLPDWDIEWTSPDNRISTLKKRTEDLKAQTSIIQSSMIDNTSNTNILKSEMNTFKKDMLLLVDMGKLEHAGSITKEEYKTMLKLYESVDEENRVVLRELVTEKLKLI